MQLVERNDLAGIAAEHERIGTALWNTLCNGESSPRYPNQGTLVHWAVWCQHWDIVTMAAAAGADLTVRGEGSWMHGRTAAEYAALLDEKANHPYYDHAKEFGRALNAIADHSRASMSVNQGWAAMRVAGRIHKNAHLELLPFDDDARIEDRAVQIRLHDMVEHHCLRGLDRAVDKFGRGAVASILIEPEDSPYGNCGTVAHWAVWYQHWVMLRWLVAKGCFNPDIKGVGAWFHDKTASEYADFFDAMCEHPFYGHRVEVEAALRERPEGDETGMRTRADWLSESARMAGRNIGPDQHLPSYSPATLPRASVCCICLDAPANHLVMPCRHLCLCGACGQGLRDCPICRAGIQSIEQVYMSACARVRRRPTARNPPARAYGWLCDESAALAMAVCVACPLPSNCRQLLAPAAFCTHSSVGLR